MDALEFIRRIILVRQMQQVTYPVTSYSVPKKRLDNQKHKE
jgi:hypothetical protein